MKRYVALLAALLGASSLVAAPLVYSGNINLQEKPISLGGAHQWDLGLKVGNTPSIRLYTYSGADAFDASSYTITFNAGPSRDDAGQIELSSSALTSTYVEFTFTTNNLAYPFDRWYSAIKFVSGSTIVSQPEGYISCVGAPEVDGGSVSFTYNRNWSLWEFSYPDSGPAIPDGSTITATTNASGQLVLSALAGSASLTNATVSGDTNFSFTVSAPTATLNVPNNLTYDSELAATSTADRAYADGLASNYATAAQGALADTALQPADTNGWETGSHTGLTTLVTHNAHTNLSLVAGAHGGETDPLALHTDQTNAFAAALEARWDADDVTVDGNNLDLDGTDAMAGNLNMNASAVVNASGIGGAAGGVLTFAGENAQLYNTWTADAFSFRLNLDGAPVSNGVYYGDGSGLTNLNASNIASGTLDTNRFSALDDLGGGSGSELLRKDGVWTNLSVSGGVWTDDGDGTISVDSNTLTATTGPSVLIQTPSSMTADTDVLQIKRGATELLALDEDGDLSVASGVAATELVATTGYIKGGTGATSPFVYLTDSPQLITYSGGWITWWTLNGGTRTAGFNPDMLDIDHYFATDNDRYALFTEGSTDRVGIGTNAPNSKLHVSGVVSLTSQTNHPSAYAGGGQIYCVSNEVYAMDSGGNFNVLSPDPDFAGGERIVQLSGNVYDDSPIEYVEAATLAAFLRGEIKADPSLVKSVPKPPYMRRDWDAEEQHKVDAANAEIQAWESNTNAPKVKGPKPLPYVKQPKPEALK